MEDKLGACLALPHPNWTGGHMVILKMFTWGCQISDDVIRKYKIPAKWPSTKNYKIIGKNVSVGGNKFAKS